MTAAPPSVPSGKVLRHVLALSDERDQWERLIEQAWRDGYRAAEQAHADDYSAGVTDGVLARKRAQHDIVEMARTDVAQWGPAGREHFGEPRPGDYPGGAAGIARTKAAWENAGYDFPHWGPEWVHLSGPTVHHHLCNSACYAYEPGWYRAADAITILETLPGDYAATHRGPARRG